MKNDNFTPSDKDRTKVKLYTYWDDYFQENKDEVLISAYIGPSTTPPRASINLVDLNRQKKATQLPVLYYLYSILLVNCSILIIISGRNSGHFSGLMRKINAYLPSHVSNLAPSVAFALGRAVASDRAAQLLAPGKSLSDQVLRSALAELSCSNENKTLSWSERTRATRQVIMQTSKHIRLRTPLEAGGEARLCGSEWASELPKLQSVASYGYESANILPFNEQGRQKGGVTLITLVTHVAISRVHMLEDQCTLWNGTNLSIAAAVYIPLINGKPEQFSGLDTAVAEVFRVAHRAETTTNFTCKLALDIVVENLCSPDAPEPINSLKNRALRMVNTEAVFLSDGFHLVSATLAEALSDKRMRKQILAAANTTTGVLIPSLAPTDPWYGRVKRQLALEIAKTRFRAGIVRQVLSQQMEGPLGWGFDNDPSARRKAFSKWSDQNHGLNEIKLAEGAAPLAIMLLKRVPFFDERARGHSWSQALHVRQSEVFAQTKVWATLANAWAVRLAPVQEEIGNGRDRQDEEKGANQALYHRFKDDVENGSYVPAVSLQEICYI